MGSLCYGQGDRQKGHQLLLEASEVYQEIGDLMMGNSLLSDIAWDIWTHGDLSKGRALMEGYLLAQRQSHFTWSIHIILEGLVSMCLTMGDYQAAQRYAQENLAVRRSFKLEMYEAGGENGLGKVSCASGNLDQARRHLGQAIKIYRKNQDKWGIAWSLNWLGLVEVYENRLEQSLALLEESQTICD